MFCVVYALFYAYYKNFLHKSVAFLQITQYNNEGVKNIINFLINGGRKNGKRKSNPCIFRWT